MAAAAALLVLSCVASVAAQDEEICPGCTDVRPVGDFTCPEQVRFNKCEADWMIDGGFCDFSCDRCSCDDDEEEADASASLLRPAPGLNGEDEDASEVADNGEEDEDAEEDAEQPLLVDADAVSVDLVPLLELEDDKGECQNTVFTAVASARQLTTLASLLTATELDIDLDDEDLEVTLFAPSNKAFNEWLDDAGVTAEDLVGEGFLNATKTILQYHVATDVLQAEDLEKSTAFGTLAKDSPLFGGSESEIEGLGTSARIVSKAIPICDSLIYLVDAVLLPGPDLEAIAPQEPETSTKGKKKAKKCNPVVDPMFAISSDSELSTFTEALNLARLSSGLANADEKFTVLAPTNDAFDELLVLLGVELEELLEDVDTLTGILEYHIIEDNLEEKDFSNGDLETVNGTIILVENIGNTIEFAGTGTSASIIDADIDESCMAAVHKIDEVLLPFRPEGSTESVVSVNTPASRVQATQGPNDSSSPSGAGSNDNGTLSCPIDLWGAINSNPSLTILAQVMELADVRVLLQNKDLTITIFAPSDMAWGALLPMGLGFFDLIPDVTVADVLLSYHFVGAPIPSKAFSDGFKIPTLLSLDGKPLSLTMKQKEPTIPDQFTLNGKVGKALFVTSDIIVCQSVIHVIDTVLLPDKDVVTSPSGTTEEAIEAASEFEAMITVARDGGADEMEDGDEEEPKPQRNGGRRNNTRNNGG